MSAVEFSIKVGDRLPIMTAQLLDENDAPVNLTGATVRFLMRPKYQSSVKINAAAVIVAALTGDVSYAWTALDTDTPGSYWGEFEVTFSGGLKATFPNSGHFDIEIYDQLGSAP